MKSFNKSTRRAECSSINSVVEAQMIPPSTFAESCGMSLTTDSEPNFCASSEPCSCRFQAFARQIDSERGFACEAIDHSLSRA